MAFNQGSRSLARELTDLATEVDSLTKALARTQEELARELTRRQRFEQEAVDLAAALAQARRRASTAEQELARLATEDEKKTHVAQVREHELQTRLNEANTMNEGLRLEVERKERQRHALEVDLSDVMQNLRHAAAEAAWPSRTNTGPTRLPDGDAEPTEVGGW
jgi:chromosome segregation ATPase